MAIKSSSRAKKCQQNNRARRPACAHVSQAANIIAYGEMYQRLIAPSARIKRLAGVGIIGGNEHYKWRSRRRKYLSCQRRRRPAVYMASTARRAARRIVAHRQRSLYNLIGIQRRQRLGGTLMRPDRRPPKPNRASMIPSSPARLRRTELTVRAEEAPAGAPILPFGIARQRETGGVASSGMRVA